MSSLHYRTNARPMKYSLCAVVVAVAAIVAILGSFRLFTSSIAAATIDNQGDYTLTGKVKFVSTKFEVSGIVQGVSFRRHTKAKAEELGLMGWCRNTPHGTVEGEYEYEVSEEQKLSPSSNEKGNHWG
eukprot:CAMPEP_0202021624 /NCGR_PEP_ID=MMETSP0905-20130828/47402_1 /ASSEMBLY_ACC=CAM_ASM_000554 /TAXON_ID=420261 /ORGANISM="Thalassiosira antarctica, Strain CCMP982" /LENGTH=127 /DNA_ID=CAMNT_0048583549 /DNA_START=61 /DNA_END=440 /DNA_ORIENTATION=+